MFFAIGPWNYSMFNISALLHTSYNRFDGRKVYQQIGLTITSRNFILISILMIYDNSSNKTLENIRTIHLQVFEFRFPYCYVFCIRSTLGISFRIWSTIYCKIYRLNFKFKYRIVPLLTFDIWGHVSAICILFLHTLVVGPSAR